LGTDSYRHSFTPLMVNNSEYEIMDMTLYELTDLQLSLFDLIAETATHLQTQLAIYLSIITAYLVTAFVAGKKLTRIQVLIASSLFVYASLNILFGMEGSIEAQDILIDMARENEKLIHAVKGLPPPEAVKDKVPWLLFSSRALLLLAIFASLYFMWSVRRSNDE
jgi:hypothetical protein